MNVVILTVLATLGGTDGYSTAGAHNEVVYASPTGDCAACGGGHGRCGHGHRPHGGWLGMMPQTCYNPTLGCYDGNRHNNRYPAFHGTYYRRPYNYRNVFDYPWHADLHEPTSNFAYNVNEMPAAAVVAPAPVPAPPAPVPAPDAFDQGANSSTKRAERSIRPTSFSKAVRFEK
jgi:hypothetical protein